MGKLRVVGLSCVSAALMIGAAPAAAYQAGDWVVRGGLAMVVPTKDYSEMDNGLELRADSETEIAVSLSYMMTDALSINVLAATPFQHTIEAKTPNGAVDVGSTYHLPPTVTLSYFPLSATGSVAQPYLGLGLNYTHFWDEKLDGGADLDLSDSWGLAAHIGVDYPINDKWGLGAEAYYIDIETDVSVDGAKIGTVDIDPYVYRISLTRRF